MNKKYLTFGFIGVFMMAFAAAALVDHFTTVQANISVESPLVLEQSLFTFDGTEILNDGQNHYLLVKGENNLAVEVPADVVITITKDGQPVTNDDGLHLAVDAGGDMHYCYDGAGNMTGVDNCDEDYVQWLVNNNNPDWFDWIGTDATYELSGFVNPIVNHGGNSWYDGSTMFTDGVMTIPGIDPNPGLIAALIVIRADFGLEPGNYTIEVELVPVA